MTDEQFFATHPTRRARIRPPVKTLEVTKQRAAHYVDECESLFRTLGDHKKDRRRIILWRVPEGNPYYDPVNPPFLKIPFLLYADETVEDTDEILLPIIAELMNEKR